MAFRDRRWSGRTGGAFIVGNLDHVPVNGAADELFGRFPDLAEPERAERAADPQDDVLVEERDSNQSHLRMLYRPQVDADDAGERAAFSIYSVLLGGSMGSRLFDEIREQRGLAYSVFATDHFAADHGALLMGAGLESGKAVEAFTRMREIVAELAADGPTEDEVERARAYAAGRRVLAFENTNAVASHAARRAIVHHEGIDPDTAIGELDAVTFDAVAEAARRVDPEQLAVAVVGPHSADEFRS